MQMTFRIECPKCHWGHEFKDQYINMGFLKGRCDHCKNDFFFKVAVSGVQVDVLQDLSEGVPCQTLDEAKTATADPNKLRHCDGCENNFYNGNNPLNIKVCWSLESAELVLKKEVPVDQCPPWTQEPKLVLSCFHKNGYVYVSGDRKN